MMIKRSTKKLNGLTDEWGSNPTHNILSISVQRASNCEKNEDINNLLYKKK